MFVSDVALKTVVVPCPKCGVQSGEVRGSFQTSDRDCGDQAGWYYALVECPGCEHPFLTRHNWCWVGGPENFCMDDLRTIYPSDGELDESVPAIVAESFAATVKTAQNGVPMATAMMCRRTLETICNELGATGYMLGQKLKELEGKMDPRLHEWAGQVVIELGNDAAHIKDDIDPEDSQDAVAFTRALIENLFVLKKAFEDFKTRREGRRASKALIQGAVQRMVAEKP
jgi:hypothetical protein